MIFIDNAKQEAKIRALEQWRRWYAWFPVQVENFDFVWLEYVERRCDFVTGHDGTYVFTKYRRPKQS